MRACAAYPYVAARRAATSADSTRELRDLRAILFDALPQPWIGVIKLYALPANQSFAFNFLPIFLYSLYTTVITNFRVNIPSSIFLFILVPLNLSIHRIFLSSFRLIFFSFERLKLKHCSIGLEKRKNGLIKSIARKVKYEHGSRRRNSCYRLTGVEL